MRIRGPLNRRSIITGPIVVSAVLVAGVLTAGPASAAPTPPTDPTTSAQVLTTLEARLGDRTPGAYLDSANRPVVTVTDDATAQTVTQAGAVPRKVPRSRSTLTAAMATLASRATIPGTSWAIDPQADQVVVSYDTTVTGASLQRLQAAIAALGSAVRLEALGGVLSPRISGGDAIFGGNVRCSLGFNVHVGSANYFLTAGHCGNVVSTWFSDLAHRTTLGPTVSSTFPGHDYALVQDTNSAVTVSGAVGNQDITSAATPVVGEAVSRRGSTTGVHTGTVTALDATVNYSEGTVTGMIRTNVCAEPGDSGGSLYAGTTALGLTSGGNGNCTSGGTTFFQPVTAALTAYNATVF